MGALIGFREYETGDMLDPATPLHDYADGGIPPWRVVEIVSERMAVVEDANQPEIRIFVQHRVNESGPRKSRWRLIVQNPLRPNMASDRGHEQPDEAEVTSRQGRGVAWVEPAWKQMELFSEEVNRAC